MSQNKQQEDIFPEGVTLREFEDFDTLRASIFDDVKNEVINTFPKSYGTVRMEVEDVDYEGPERFSISEQKKGILQNRYLTRRLRGTVKLYDDETNELLDETKMTLMRVPYLTNRGTFIHNGSEYVTLTQARLMPGAYTRRKQTGELETHFNAARGSGNSFRIHLEPETGLFKMNIGQSSLRLYSLLKDLGMSDEELEEAWGKDILEANKSKYDSRVLDKAYQRLLGRRAAPAATREEKVQQIKEAISNTKVDRHVLERTLPEALQQALDKIATETNYELPK